MSSLKKKKKKNPLCTCVQNLCKGVFIKTLHVHTPFMVFTKTVYMCTKPLRSLQCTRIQNPVLGLLHESSVHVYKTGMKSSQWHSAHTKPLWSLHEAVCTPESFLTTALFFLATLCWVSVGTAQRQQGNSLTPLSLCTGKGERCRVS